MSVGYGILGFLSYGPMTGYDLAKAFEASLEFFWHAQNSQIYLELKSLEKKGYVTGEVSPQEGRPNKKVFSITDAGRTAFLRWLAQPPGAETTQFKSAFLMKLFFGGNLPPAQSIQNLKIFREGCQRFLAGMETVPGSIQHYGANKTSAQTCYWGFTVDFGYSFLSTCVQWAERCIRKLEEMEEEHHDED